MELVRNRRFALTTADIKLKVYKNDRLLPFCSILTYLGVKLNRSLTFCYHLVALCKKLERRLAHSHWMPASHSSGPLTILSGIQPAELRRLGVTLSLAYCGSLDPDHILYGLLTESSDARQENKI